MSNPDTESERRLLQQLAPELSADALRRLVAAFQDLRQASDSGKLSYPYSLRGMPDHFVYISPAILTDPLLPLIDAELINIVRHMRAYPDDTLEDTLRNVFDFDVYKPEAIDLMIQVFNRHGFVQSCFFF